MFEAICSRTTDQTIITADQAYSLVFNQSDWGATQSCDQGCLKVCSGRVRQRRNASQRQHPLDVVGQLPEALAD